MNCDVVERGKLIRRYLLGELDESQRADFEDHYFECRECFSQTVVEEDQLLTRYALGDVTEEERRQMERHFLRGAARNEQLAAKRELIAGLRQSAPDGANEPNLAAIQRAPAWWDRWTWILRPAAALAAFLAIGAALLSFQLFRAHRELQESREQIRQLEQSLRQQEELTKSLQASQQTNSGEDAQRENQANAPAGQRPQLVQKPTPRGSAVIGAISADTRFVRLVPALRSGDSEIPAFALPPRDTPIVFYLEFEAVDARQHYILRLRDARQEVVWRASRAIPRAPGAFVLTVPSSRLHPGEYHFELRAKEAAAERPLANYPFHCAASSRE